LEDIACITVTRRIV